MDNTKLLTDLVERSYGAEGAILQPLPSDTGKRIYRVDRANGPRWVLRVYEAANDASAAQTLVATLLFLEEQSYPAERLVCSVEQTPIVIADDGAQLLMTTFLEGKATDYSPATLRLLGARLGHLHALPLAAENALARRLPLAEMRPTPEVSWALGQLASVASRVPPHLQGWYETLREALHSIDPCEDLPRVFIHNDCHPGNTIHTPAGEVVLLDWEGSGLGAAVIDIGFLLISCDTVSPWTLPLPPDPARIKAVIEGYCQHHRLTAAELERLPDTMRFRSLVYGAWSFAEMLAKQEQGSMNDGQAITSQWWWKRYLAADELAERARKLFAEERT
jgi:Ser/Thr protein kinase RdoA (MazF antagonist)